MSLIFTFLEAQNLFSTFFSYILWFSPLYHGFYDVFLWTFFLVTRSRDYISQCVCPSVGNAVAFLPIAWKLVTNLYQIFTYIIINGFVLDKYIGINFSGFNLNFWVLCQNWVIYLNTENPKLVFSPINPKLI